MFPILITVAFMIFLLGSLSFVMFWVGVNYEHRTTTRQWARRAITAEAITEILAHSLAERGHDTGVALSRDEIAAFNKIEQQFRSRTSEN
jgi:hypothetical protein